MGEGKHIVTRLVGHVSLLIDEIIEQYPVAVPSHRQPETEQGNGRVNQYGTQNWSDDLW